MNENSCGHATGKRARLEGRSTRAKPSRLLVTWEATQYLKKDLLTKAISGRYNLHKQVALTSLVPKNLTSGRASNPRQMQLRNTTILRETLHIPQTWHYIFIFKD